MLEKIYPEIKKSIVAIALDEGKTGGFPKIIGTGFFIHESGLVVTNSHVVEKIKEIAGVISQEELCDAIAVLYFHYSDKESVKIAPLAVGNVFQLTLNIPQNSVYYGDERLDISLILLKNVKDCPHLSLFSGNYLEGQEIAVSGFPMGNRNIQNQNTGFVHQLGPTLQKGVVGAVLPTPCKTPHAFLVDIMMQGGSSGSPVFFPTSGEVVGIVYEKRLDIDEERYISTALSAVMPSWYLSKALETYLNKDLNIKGKVPLNEWLITRNIIKQEAGKPFIA